MQLDETPPELAVDTIVKLDGMAFVVAEYDFVEGTDQAVVTLELLDGNVKAKR